MLTRRELLCTAASAAATTVSGHAMAQTFPSRPIRLVVPFTAGGTGDFQARVIGEHMGRALGQPVVVENKPGGGTVIGTAQVAQAPADGHTLLLMANSFVINAKLRAGTLPYRDMKAFEPVACLTNSPQLIAINSASPWRTFKEWMDAAKTKPDALSYATVGPATTQHIAGEMLARQAGVQMIYVPFAGGAQAVNAVLGGHASMVLANVNELQSFIEAGKMRALAVSTSQRLASMPQIPTVSESGVTGYDTSAWFGLCAPAGTPKDTVARLSRAALNALADPEIRKKLVDMGLEPYGMDQSKFAAHLNDQYAKYVKVIDEAGIKA